MSTDNTGAPEPTQGGDAVQNPPTPPRPKTPNDAIFQRFLVHPITQFDERVFMDLLEHSLSLSTFEKKRVVDSIPTLSQLQIDELTKVFEDERVEFRKLMDSEWEIIKWLVVKAQNEWEQLKDIYTEEEKSQAQSQKDSEKADEIKKNLWL